MARDANFPGRKVVSMRTVKRRRKRGKLLYEGLIVGAFMTVVIVQSLNDKIGIPSASALPAASTLMRANFPVCGSAKRYTCIVDGDTVWLKGEKMRLSGINAPEVGNPKCRREAELAAKATRRLRTILNSNEWSVERFGHDKYGRTLVNFRIDQTTAGDMLIRAGLAHRWEGYKRNWC